MAPLLKWSAVGLALLAAIVLPFLLFTAESERLVGALLGPEGPPGLLLALIVVGLLAADAFLPIPSSLVSVAAIALFGWAGGLLIWFGMTIGCGLGYWLGSRAGAPLANRFLGQAEMARARSIAAGIGPAALVLTRAVPVLAEAATIAAGLAAMPPRRFAAATGLANAGIASLYAAASAAAASTGSFLALFAAAIAVPLLGWVALRLAGSARPA